MNRITQPNFRRNLIMIGVVMAVGVAIIMIFMDNDEAPAPQTPAPPLPQAQIDGTINARLTLSALSLTPPAPTATVTPTSTPHPCPPGFAGCQPITANRQWTPLEQTFEDGVLMVMVPAGCFMMGSELGASDELPLHEVCFDAPFWIDKYEVSNEQFKRLGGQARLESQYPDDTHPREKVAWFEARDFCALRGARLPTEAEWEYAARGPDNLNFPWGNGLVRERVVYSGTSYARTAPVDSRPEGVSWVGAYHLSGNVSEWVEDVYAAYLTEPVEDESALRVIRGGSWASNRFYVRSAVRGYDRPGDSDAYRGIRCAKGSDDA